MTEPISGHEQRSFIFVLFHSLWVWGTLAALTLVWLVLMTVTFAATVWWDRRRFWTSRLFRKLAVVHRFVVPSWEFVIEGDLPADADERAYIFVVNHVSVADILLLAHLRTDKLFLTKSSLVNAPVVGWCMKMAGDVAISRGDDVSRDEALSQCREALSSGLNVVIYPEGTRSAAGALGDFRAGAFLLAAETGASVVPVAVSGAQECIASRGWRTGPGRAVARILPPLSPSPDLMLADRDAVAEEVSRLRDVSRDAIESCLSRCC